jgi:hypothetical protein
MDKIEIASFYHRDIQKVIDEINLFKHQINIWKTCGSIKNSAGNLVLHLLGGLNYLIGTNLGKTNYLRNRDKEFTMKDNDRKTLVGQLTELSLMIDRTLNSLTNEQLESNFPIFFDKENATTRYVLIQLLIHLNYHLGQINYLRRVLE